MIIKLIRGILHLLYLFPVKKRKIIFECYLGKQYSCSPRAISEYLSEKEGGRYELVWVYLDTPLALCPEKQVKRGSLKWYYHMLTAGTVIMNSGFCQRIPFRRRQIVMNTWHGGGAYKRIVDSPELMNWYNRQISVFLSSSERFTELEIRGAMGFRGEVLNTGLPRNDVFFDAAKRTALSEKVRNALKLKTEAAVLYAPTWFEGKEMRDPDFGKLCDALSKRFRKTFSVLYRKHYHESAKPVLSENVIDVSAYPDMQELLLASDVLVTDYSSSIWDYSFLGRPILLYAPDIEEFRKNQGFYYDPEECGFPLAKTEEELWKRIAGFDEASFRSNMEKHHNELGSCETGEACRMVAERLRRK